MLVVDGYRPSSETWGGLRAPDEEVGERSYFLSDDIRLRPLRSGSPHRPFDLFPEFSGYGGVVFIGRGDARRECQVEALAVGQNTFCGHGRGSALHDGASEVGHGLGLVREDACGVCWQTQGPGRWDKNCRGGVYGAYAVPSRG